MIKHVLVSCKLTFQHYNNQFRDGIDGSTDGYASSVGTGIDRIAEENDERQIVGSSQSIYPGDTARGGYDSSSDQLSEKYD